LQYPLIYAIGKKIRRFRKQQYGWTLDELSKKTNLSTGNLSDIENGHKKQDIRLSTLILLAEAFKVDVVDLIPKNLSEPKESELHEWYEHDYDLWELSHNITLPGQKIDGIEITSSEAKQIVNFARFLVLQREEKSEEILKKVTEFIKQREE